MESFRSPDLYIIDKYVSSIAVNLYKKIHAVFCFQQQVHFPCQMRPSRGNASTYEYFRYKEVRLINFQMCL